MATNAVSSSPSYKRVYVWEMPVRVFHWINALAIFVLIITGYLIGNPISLEYSNEAYQQYWFGTVRFIHFVTAFVFFFNVLFRTYWGFVGNKYSRWYNFIPYKKSQWQEMVEVMKVDVLQTKIKGKISIGHNTLAGFVYFITFWVFAFQVVTGFALYSSMSDSWLPGLFSWVVPLMGGDFALRQWHHAFMWFYVVFIIIHVYLVFYHDYVEGRGTTSSMVGGWKFERDDYLKENNYK